jgi:hypothetical protein
MTARQESGLEIAKTGGSLTNRNEGVANSLRSVTDVDAIPFAIKNGDKFAPKAWIKVWSDGFGG